MYDFHVPKSVAAQLPKNGLHKITFQQALRVFILFFYFYFILSHNPKNSTKAYLNELQ